MDKLQKPSKNQSIVNGHSREKYKIPNTHQKITIGLANTQRTNKKNMHIDTQISDSSVLNQESEKKGGDITQLLC